VGKIAYNTRDHSHDNPVTQLIRHTIEHIKTHPFGSGVLHCDNDTRDIVNMICSVTQKRYARTERKQVVQANLKPVSHPYFTEYKPLQNICLQILRRDGLTFGLEKDKIYGLLFDGAWLWEEYLNTFLKELFLHSKNKEKKDGYPLFESKSQSIYPDFVKPNPESKSKMEMVADAKYSPLESTDTKVGEEKATRIYYKTITYMYRLKSKKGFLIYPFKNSEQTVKQDMYTIKGTDGTLTKIGMNIPQFANSFPKFCEEMKASEKQVLKVFGIQQNN
jgi:5-methylcytosine-specific restriction endonuclease McrBC regulatory subunit McrC